VPGELILIVEDSELVALDDHFFDAMLDQRFEFGFLELPDGPELRLGSRHGVHHGESGVAADG
jgi:hypothetical protein